MGQKIHPVSLRIQSSTCHFDQAWYSDHFFSNLISIDLSLYSYLNNFFKSLKLPTGRFSIYHLSKTTKLYNFFCYPKQSRELKSKLFHVSTSLPTRALKRDKNLKKKNLARKKALVDLNLLKKASTFSFNTIPPVLFLKLTSFESKNVSAKKLIFNNLYFLTRKFQTNTSLQRLFELKKLSNYNKHYSCLLWNKYKIPHTQKLCKKTALNLIILKKVLLVFQMVNNSYKPDAALQLDSSFIKFFQKFEKQDHNGELKYNNLLENSLSKYLKVNTTIIPFQVIHEWQDAGYFADEIVFLLERRIPFRQIKNKILKQLTTNSSIRGVRITCSGRVGGKSKKAQRAKIDSIKYGQTSLHIFSAKIDFALRTAYTSLGSTGVKVWICYT